jgi:hypothetical protein
MKIGQTMLFLIWAISISATAWAFWHYLGPYADMVLMIIVITGLLWDNRRLRKATQRHHKR